MCQSRKALVKIKYSVHSYSLYSIFISDSYNAFEGKGYD